MYKRKCKHCEEYFFTTIRNKQYCSKECIIDRQRCKQKPKREKNHRLDSGAGQKCWICGNACGGCSWSRDGVPVEGWVAKKRAVKYRGVLEYYSYNIIYCPQFWQDVEVEVHKHAADINRRIKLVRNRLGFTQKEFGRVLESSKIRVSRIETGRSAVTRKDILIICEAFNINEGWLCTGEGNMFKEEKICKEYQE